MHTAVTTSPINCQWIRRSTVGTVEGIAYGVCRRLRGAERLVSEVECEFCPLWEPPLSGADARASVPIDATPLRAAGWNGIS
jgi:hypothetical protein